MTILVFLRSMENAITNWKFNAFTRIAWRVIRVITNGFSTKNIHKKRYVWRLNFKIGFEISRRFRKWFRLVHVSFFNRRSKSFSTCTNRTDRDSKWFKFKKKKQIQWGRYFSDFYDFLLVRYAVTRWFTCWIMSTSTDLCEQLFW